MARRWGRRSAYYGRNYGNEYSRSAGAQEAENQGRYPRTKAAKHLGVSVKAFDAGCEAAGYRSTEWHHVGKYASMIDYYDTNELESSAAFWRGAASAYKIKARVQAHLERAATCEERENKWLENLRNSPQLESASPADSPPNAFNSLEASLAGTSYEVCWTASGEAQLTTSSSGLATA